MAPRHDDAMLADSATEDDGEPLFTGNCQPVRDIAEGSWAPAPNPVTPIVGADWGGVPRGT